MGLTGTQPCDDPPREDGASPERQLLHCVFACAVIAVVVSDGGLVVLFSCLPPRKMSSHGVVRSPVSLSSLDGVMPLLLCKSGCFSTLIDCVSKSTYTFTSCSSGTFQQLDEDVYTPRSVHLAHDANGRESSAHLIFTGSHGDPV